MKIIISPAKSLDYNKRIFTDNFTIPIFQKEIKTINNCLKKKKPQQLSKLMGISDKLAEINWQRNQDFNLSFTKENAKQAVFVFSGDVYKGLDVDLLSPKELSSLQQNLFILSGLYGILKPLDLIQPYRLEMGSNLKIGANKNLYSFWKQKLTKHLISEMENDTILLNLASKEYSSVIDFKILEDKRIITPHFKSFNNGNPKIISFFAKKARGMMTRFAVKNNCKSLEDILLFNDEGYEYSNTFTKKPNEPVFIKP